MPTQSFGNENEALLLHNNNNNNNKNAKNLIVWNKNVSLFSCPIKVLILSIVWDYPINHWYFCFEMSNDKLHQEWFLLFVWRFLSDVRYFCSLKNSYPSLKNKGLRNHEDIFVFEWLFGVYFEQMFLVPCTRFLVISEIASNTINNPFI